MRPRSQEPSPQDELFRSRLENLIDQRHELVRLAELIDWEEFDRQWGPLFSDKRGAPAIPTRLIAGLHYLKHLYKLSDEEVVRRWVENVYWQYFCGETYFQHKLPIHPTSMTRWRKRIGEEGCEWLLTQTIEAGRKSGVLKDKDCRRVNVDTTVQEKAVAFPTDSKLLDDARCLLVKLAKRHGIRLRQNYNRVAKRYRLKIARYAHAKQYRRMRAESSKNSEPALGGWCVTSSARSHRARALCQAALRSNRSPPPSGSSIRRPKDKHKLYSVYAPRSGVSEQGQGTQAL